MGLNDVVLRGGHDVTGAALDLRIDRDTGLVAERGSSLSADGSDVVDCTGYVVLPAPAEPHAHLDKAYTADAVPNPLGDLGSALAAYSDVWAAIEPSDIVRRASRGVIEAVRSGCMAIRTHVDLSPMVGLKSVHALLDVQRRAHALELVELQVSAMIQPPVSGLQGVGDRGLITEALAAGVDLIGGATHREPEPAAFLDIVFELADEHQVDVDLHVDETVDDVHTLDVLLDIIERDAPAFSVTASHCVSLGMLDLGRQRETAQRVAEAGIGVVTLPTTNLFLQSRDRPTATPRGLTAIDPLLAAGASLCAGSDNVRDPFSWLGAHDPLLTAQLLVSAGHTSIENAWRMVSHNVHIVLGRNGSQLEVGQRGDVLAVHAPSGRDAIATATDGRMVLRGGRIISAVTVQTIPGPLEELIA